MALLLEPLALLSELLEPVELLLELSLLAGGVFGVELELLPEPVFALLACDNKVNLATSGTLSIGVRLQQYLVS